jgi:hypothetical protein
MPQQSTKTAPAPAPATPVKRETPGARERRVCLERSFDESLPDDQKRIIVRDLGSYGQIDQAKKVLAQIADSPATKVLAGVINRIEAGETVLKMSLPHTVTRVDPVMGRQLEGIMILPTAKPNADALLVFCGNAERDFILPTAMLALRDHHVIFLRDTTRCFSLCELPRVGPDFHTNIARIKHILITLKAKNVFCAGESAGGFAALKFALELEANGVLGCGVPITINMEELNATFEMFPMLEPLYNKDPSMATNMAQEYAARKKYPRMLLVYGEKHRRDASFAQMAALLPGVKLMPIPDVVAHTAFQSAALTPLLPTLLQQLFALEPYVAED